MIHICPQPLKATINWMPVLVIAFKITDGTMNEVLVQHINSDERPEWVYIDSSNNRLRFTP